jgi:hypothetical protein
MVVLIVISMADFDCWYEAHVRDVLAADAQARVVNAIALGSPSLT